MSEHRTIRDHLHEAIQGTVGLPSPSDDEGDELPDGSMLMGWVTVAEWMSPEGSRWLSKIEGTSTGQRPPAWHVQGYLHNALHDWPDVGDDEDGDGQ